MHEQLRQYYLQQIGVESWVKRLPRQQTIENSSDELELLRAEIASCTRCPLHKTRTQAVFARGNPKARLMIIGEAPGFHEDKQGLPFVGKAGGLLNKMLKSINLEENDVFIVNILKCRPPNNRDPKHEEIQACSDHLVKQIKLVDPELILGVGRFAGQFLLNELRPLNKMRNQVHYFQGKPVLISYHPAYLLRNPIDKRKAFADLIRVRKFIDDIGYRLAGTEHTELQAV